ncbi:hypothetical protein CCMSSC00406_0007601 [Pleurotus cornucopiae]|uniref:Uncharacterized protein n=1 Tax=Pleurotus cornucopiae TaxID=5321 RepID=A0ACB7J077_PLECO|nr:hypothetical protein CCMSSC00406_0007601 [Pleurotus cornucopiae]
MSPPQHLCLRKSWGKYSNTIKRASTLRMENVRVAGALITETPAYSTCTPWVLFVYSSRSSLIRNQSSTVYMIGERAADLIKYSRSPL